MGLRAAQSHPQQHRAALELHPNLCRHIRALWCPSVQGQLGQGLELPALGKVSLPKVSFKVLSNPNQAEILCSGSKLESKSLLCAPQAAPFIQLWAEQSQGSLGPLPMLWQQLKIRLRVLGSTGAPFGEQSVRDPFAQTMALL